MRPPGFSFSHLMRPYSREATQPPGLMLVLCIPEPSVGHALRTRSRTLQVKRERPDALSVHSRPSSRPRPAELSRMSAAQRLQLL